MLSKAIKSQLTTQKVEEVKEQMERISIKSDIPQELIDEAIKEFAAIKADSSLSNGESIIQVYYTYKKFEKRYSKSDEELEELTKQRRELYPQLSTKQNEYKKVILTVQAKINQLQEALFYEAGKIFEVPLKTFEAMFLNEATRFEMASDQVAMKTFESKHPRDQVKEMFLELTAYKNKHMMTIFTKYRADLEKEGDNEPPAEFEREVQILEAQSEDHVFNKFGVEMGDVRLEILHHKIDQDDDLQALLSQRMMAGEQLNMLEMMQGRGDAANISDKEKSSQPKDLQEWHKVALEEIDKLGEVKKNDFGGIQFEYFMELMLVITRQARSSIASLKRDLVEKRRKLLKDFDLDEYKQVVKKLIKIEEEAIRSLTDVTLAHIKISEQQFMMTQQMIMMNPEQSKTFMQGQQCPEYDRNKEPTITFEKAKQIFLEQEGLRASTMKAIMEKAMSSPAFTEEAQMEQMIEGMVANARIVDIIFEKHGVDDEEQNQAVIKYNLMEDPECQAKMMELMQMFPF